MSEPVEDCSPCAEYAVREDKLRKLLAEAGYPNAVISQDEDGPAVDLMPSPNGVPDLVVWRAFRLLLASEGTRYPCFECWMGGYGPECADGDCRQAVPQFDGYPAT